MLQSKVVERGRARVVKYNRRLFLLGVGVFVAAGLILLLNGWVLVSDEVRIDWLDLLGITGSSEPEVA